VGRSDYLLVALEVELPVDLDSMTPIPTPPIAPAKSPNKIRVDRRSRMGFLLLDLDMGASERE
jgi:hypothetical protein